MSSPRRRSPQKTVTSGSSTPKDVAVDVPARALPEYAVVTHAEEETKDQKLSPLGLTATPSEKAVGFLTELPSSGTSPFDPELGPKVLSPQRAKSSVLQTTGVEIAFHQLSLTATYVSKNMKRKTRRILKNISGITPCGSCTALMGPSGCGKTSLLHTLAGKNAKSKISGHILVDGKAREEGFSAKIGYVEQDDQLMGVMSVRENIHFSAELRLPVSISKNEKRCRVEDTIELLGLWKCANSKIGTEMIRGVSGGERKRCSIAMELVVDPAVIFLDEPTSGEKNQWEDLWRGTGKDGRHATNALYTFES
jgi:ABC-type lipoprotein export system ATPase subunit